VEYVYTPFSIILRQEDGDELQCRIHSQDVCKSLFYNIDAQRVKSDLHADKAEGSFVYSSIVHQALKLLCSSGSVYSWQIKSEGGSSFEIKSFIPF
jgi:hypothetical protein